MTTNTIVQLARFNSTNKPLNAEWTNAIREPIILNQGDTVSVRQAFVDSRLNSSTNIVIDIDTEISLVYYFYVMYPCDVNSWQDTEIIENLSQTNFDESPGCFASAKTSATDYVAFATFNGWSDSGEGTPVPIGTPNAIPPTFQRLQRPLNTFETARGLPLSPNSYKTNFAPINQCQANEIPMLLITFDPSKNPVDQVPITKTWRYTLKAGSYSPAEIAEIFTKSMAEIQSNKTTPSVNPTQLFGGTIPTDLNNFLIKGTSIVTQLNAPCNNPDNRVFPYVFTDTNRYYANLVQTQGMRFSSNSDAFAGNPNQNGLFTNFLVDTPFNTDYYDETYTNYYGYQYYDPSANLARQFTNPIAFMPCHFGGGIGMYSSDTNQNLYSGVANWTKEYSTPVVGASQISLEYNTETGLFQFTYLHTPIMEQPLTAGTASQDASEPIEVVKIIKTVNINIQETSDKGDRAYGEVKICEQTRHSGILFQSMNPPDFWQNVMGFDVPNIVIPQETIWGPNRTLTFQEFNKRTTSSYVGIENNFNTTMTSTAGSVSNLVVQNKNAPAYLSPFPTQPLPNYQGKAPTSFISTYTQLMNSDEWILDHYELNHGIPPGNEDYDYDAVAGPNSAFYEEFSSASTSTNPLLGIQNPLSQTNGSGHYFVEVVGYNNNVNDFVNDNSIYAIKSIVASYYVSPNSFITLPFQDTAVYEHIGDTQYINKFRVRLLDPLTMKPASPLGPNSSVYLQIGKQMTKIALEQPM